MLLSTEYIVTHHLRTSKSGLEHPYTRLKAILVFRCDKCGATFNRDKGTMSPHRLSNNYYHVCGNCDAKRFAQEKGVEGRKIWDMPVSSLKTIGRL